MSSMPLNTNKTLQFLQHPYRGEFTFDCSRLYLLCNCMSFVLTSCKKISKVKYCPGCLKLSRTQAAVYAIFDHLPRELDEDERKMTFCDI